MKRLLFILLLLISQQSFATNWYISNSGDNAHAGTTPSTPWQTISKVNSSFSGFASGDSVLFERGGIFYGEIIVNKSGSSGNPIIISSYGTGAKPIITGFTTASGFTSIGINLWESTVITGTNRVNMVTESGIPTGMGRYPNSGYRTFQTSNANISITDNTLANVPNFTGGEVCVRKYHWYLSRDSISNHAGNTITYVGTSGLNSNDGFGYFVQNHFNTLDAQGEWFFNKATRKIDIYSATSPTNIKVSTIDTLFYIAGFDNITIDGIAFDGGNVSSIVFGTTLSASTNITIKNCDLNNSGRDAIYGTNDDLATITNNTIYNSYNNAIYLENEGGYSTNATITSNDINQAGYIAGMGYANQAYGTNYSGITVYGANPLIQYNTIDSVGYNAIAFFYNNSKIYNNFINNFCFVKDDGGGIYTVDMQGLIETGREIVGNIVLNAIGAGQGTTDGSSAQGIYVDDRADGIAIVGNTVGNSIYASLYVHNGTNLNIRANTFYNGMQRGQLFVHDSYATGFPIRSVTDNSNIVYVNTAGVLITEISTIRNDIDTMFTMIDSNVYARPISPSGTIIHTTRTVGVTPTAGNYTLATWKTAYPLWDIHTSQLPLNTATPELKYNASSSPLTYNFSGFSKIDVYGTVYNNSAIIPAWSSKILLPNGVIPPSNINPVANAGANQTITLPTNTTTLLGSGTDADGTIVGYNWTKLLSSPPGINFITSNVQNLPINNLVQGTYQFELTVTDNQGAIGKDTVQVTVNPSPNLNPVVTVRADTTIVLPTNSVSLTGSATDDGTIVSYQWQKDTGPSTYTIVSVNSANTTVGNLIQGVYKFTLIATDNLGATGSKSVNITVLSNPTPVPSTSIILYNWKIN